MSTTHSRPQVIPIPGELLSSKYNGECIMNNVFPEK